MRGQIRTLRRVLRRNGDAATKIYVTEIGWGSDGFESRWERGIRGQARELNRAFAMLANNRRGWRIGGVWWFSWADAEGPACQFCDSAGLLTRDRRSEAGLVPLQRLDRGRSPHGAARTPAHPAPQRRLSSPGAG